MTARRILAVAGEALKLALIIVLFALLGALLGSPL